MLLYVESNQHKTGDLIVAPWRFSKYTLSVTQQKKISTHLVPRQFLLLNFAEEKMAFFAKRNMEKYDAHDARVQYEYV